MRATEAEPDSLAWAKGAVSVEDPDLVPYDSTRNAIEVEQAEWGFIVRASAAPVCGCDHSFARYAFRVGRDGNVCRTAEAAVPMALSTRHICVD